MESAKPIDLEAYFRRINYEGSREPSLQTLSRLHLLHALSIPFENLDSLQGRPINLDLPSLQAKLVSSGRGGYCYEQNTLFEAVLRALGFRVSGLAARVLWGREELAITPRIHMLLRVDLLEGIYLVDVGFGRLTPTAPLRLEQDVEQPTPHEPFRLYRLNSSWIVEAKAGDIWRGLYSVDLADHFDVDYEIYNYFVSTSPNSIFVHSLMAARPTPSGRYAIFNSRLTIQSGSEIAHVRDLTSPQELIEVLREKFDIMISPNAKLYQVIQRKLFEGSGAGAK